MERRRKGNNWSQSSSEQEPLEAEGMRIQMPRLARGPERRTRWSPVTVLAWGLCLALLVVGLLSLWLGGLGGQSEAPLKGSVLLDDVESGVVSGILPAELRAAEAEMEERTGELKRVRDSVLSELREAETALGGLRTTLEELRREEESLKRRKAQLLAAQTRLQAQVGETERELADQRRRDTPPIRLPARLQPAAPDNSFKPSAFAASRPCTVTTCMDLSRCSAFHGLTVSLPPGLTSVVAVPPKPGTQPCLRLRQSASSATLTYNDLLYIPRPSGLPDSGSKAMVASPVFPAGRFRRDFDVVLPFVVDEREAQTDVWRSLPASLPLHRKYLLSFAGEMVASRSSEEPMRKLMALVSASLQRESGSGERVQLAWECGKRAWSPGAESGDWALCEEWPGLLRESTFGLVLPSAEVAGGAAGSSESSARQLATVLRAGAVPVVLSKDLLLPFAERVPWEEVAVVVHAARLGELHLRLSSMADEDLSQLKLNGRAYYERFLCCRDMVLDTTLALLRDRLDLPGVPEKAAVGEPVFPGGAWSPDAAHTTELPEAEDEEWAGPVELPHPSPAFVHNFTLSSLHSRRVWAELKSPWEAAAYVPWRVALPSEAQFWADTAGGFRPIGDGAGGSGREFRQRLGGNFPREQFTIVVLTYQRVDVLLQTLQNFNHLPFLNKVVVVWNSPEAPPEDMLWPRLSAPLVVVRGRGNSLNNRFLPLEQIETEAVFSVDDDVHLTKDEIVFAFRAWREERGRIVGFPGRFHAWQGGLVGQGEGQGLNGWRYDSNHSCQLSMVLTGAAFVHRWYLSEYSRRLGAVRQRVDEALNCEDLAMNALVAHTTRQPPLKVTVKWTFRCPGCPETLSADEAHFAERHACLRLIAQVYGHNPLLYTQFRLDSVLFKTRLPHHHTKCFPFI